MTPTPKQLAILIAIRDFRVRNGYSPTMQELADQLDVSKVTIFEHVEALEKKQLLLRARNRARSLEISPTVKLPDESKPASFPVVGTIAAGRPIEAIESGRETLDLETLFMTRHGTYVLRVKGNSMIDDHIMDGDYVIIERREQAKDGEIVVALLEDGQATLKRYFKERGRVRLQPANATMSPIYVEKDLKIQGVLIGVLRTCAKGPAPTRVGNN
ncbi:MAG: transcriptional repressor LexA [Phycisphaerales bacterium]|nr:transcriptional repressor LexA [Phycisphaerales bacterium]